MRDRETIDSELRRIAMGRRSIRERGGQPSSPEIDELLDELLAHGAGAPRVDAEDSAETLFVPDTWSRDHKPRTPNRRRRGVRLRLSLFALLPLSLVAVAASVVIFAVHHRDSAAQPADAEPSAAPPASSSAPTAPAPRIDMADMAFIGALKHEGVPMPSQDYAMAQGHAVCDFLAHQHNFGEAVDFVQRSSIWNADQSGLVTAGAIVAYCPQSQPTAPDQLSPAYQKTLSDLQAIDGKLQGIQGDLQGIQGDLDSVLGHR